MIKTLNVYCPTKDTTVDLKVNYLFAGSLEDGNKKPYIKSLLISCSACDTCNTCIPHSELPHTIYQ